MKKYLKLFVLFLVLGLMLSTSVVKAEDRGSTGATDTSTTTSGGLTPSDVKIKGHYDIKEANKRQLQTTRTEIQGERKTFTDKLKTERDAFMAEVKTKRDEFKTADADRKAQFCQMAKDIFTRRFTFAISQLETYQGKVGDLITQLTTDGKDTTLATESLNLSKQKLADAKTKLAEVKALVPAGGCADMTAEIFGNIKLGVREAKDLLKESKDALHQAIKEIRTLKGEDQNTQ